MRIDATTPLISTDPKSLGRAVRERALLNSSTETADILEFSSRSRLAAALGPSGFEALQSLFGESESGRFEALLSRLMQSTSAEDSTSGLLDFLVKQANGEDPGGARDLFSQIEKRGVSGNLEYLNRLDGLFSLGPRNIASLFSSGEDLSDDEMDVYLDSVSRLLSNGVVGTMTVEFRGEPKTVFVENELGSEYARSPLYRSHQSGNRFPI